MIDNSSLHLCQPDLNKSCGACCGLYNYADSTKASLSLRLKRRTELFKQSAGNKEGLHAFSGIIKALEDQSKLYEEIYCCEYLGFIDDEEKKVGCLMHPLQQSGLDLRDISFYGKDLCANHLCPSYHHLSRQEKLALINIIDDWYLYGLCVTDIDLVKVYFRMISERIYEVPDPAKFKYQDLKEISLRFFLYKVSWPFRSSSINRFGKYYFDGSQYMIHHIDYDALGCETSRFDRIFLSLCSEFKTAEDLRAGERLIENNIDEFIRAYALHESPQADGSV